MFLRQLSCRHPNNHFAVSGQLNQKQNCTECAEPKPMVPSCETNSALKIAINYISDGCDQQLHNVCGWVYIYANTVHIYYQHHQKEDCRGFLVLLSLLESSAKLTF